MVYQAKLIGDKDDKENSTYGLLSHNDSPHIACIGFNIALIASRVIANVFFLSLMYLTKGEREKARAES